MLALHPGAALTGTGKVALTGVRKWGDGQGVSGWGGMGADQTQEGIGSVEQVSAII